MILQQQILMGNANRVLIPEFVQRKYNAFSGTTTFSFVVDATPVEGNFMILTVGGSSVRTPTFDGSYTVVNLAGSGVSNYIAYKFAGAGESTTQTVTWNLSQNGSMQYYEFRNIDNNPAIVSGSTFNSTFTTQTSQAYTTYNVAGPSVYVPNLVFTNSHTWSIDNAFQIQPTVSRFFSAYKIYTGPVNGEVTTWSGDSASGEYSMIAFNGKST